MLGSAMRNFDRVYSMVVTRRKSQTIGRLKKDYGTCPELHFYSFARAVYAPVLVLTLIFSPTLINNGT